MVSKYKLKNIKWFTIAGSLINLAVVIILFVGMVSAIANIENLGAINNGYTANQAYLLIRYYIIVNVLSIDILFSFLLISMSFRIDQIFYRLKWVDISTPSASNSFPKSFWLSLDICLVLSSIFILTEVSILLL